MQTVSIKKATTITVIGKYSGVVIQFVYLAILSRILTPTEFGVVAIITVFTTFFALFSNMGIGPAIIQNKSLNNQDIKSIFALTFYIALTVTLVFSLLGFPLAIFFSNDAYRVIAPLISISLFFNTINIVPNALLLKGLRFKLVTLRTITVALVSAAVTIYLALIGFSYYAIVAHSIIMAVMTFFWNTIFSRASFGFRTNRSSLAKIVEFSKYQYGFSLINYFSRNLDNLLIGRFIGDTQLGFYNRSYQLMSFPIQNFTHVITPVLHPILSVYEDQVDIIYTKYTRILKFLSVFAIFVMVYTFFNAREIILIVFGSQWEGSIRSLQFLSLSLWAQMLTSSSGSIFQSINKTKLFMKTGILNTIITVGLILVGILSANINVVALLVSLAYVIRFFVVFYSLTNFGFKNSYLDFLKTFKLDFLGILVLASSSFMIDKLVLIESIIVSSLVNFIILGAIYMLFLLLSKQYKFILGFI